MRLIRSTVRGNVANGSAGGICQRGRMVIVRSLVVGNATTTPQYDPYGGGGIETYGRLWLVDSRVTDNRAGDHGGGIYVSDGRATIVRSPIAATTASSGGGIANQDRLVVRDSTIADNKGYYRGGGIDNSGPLTLVGSTVTGEHGIAAAAGSTAKGASWSGTRPSRTTRPVAASVSALGP